MRVSWFSNIKAYTVSFIYFRNVRNGIGEGFVGISQHVWFFREYVHAQIFFVVFFFRICTRRMYRHLSWITSLVLAHGWLWGWITFGSFRVRALWSSWLWYQIGIRQQGPQGFGISRLKGLECILFLKFVRKMLETPNRNYFET